MPGVATFVVVNTSLYLARSACDNEYYEYYETTRCSAVTVHKKQKVRLRLMHSIPQNQVHSSHESYCFLCSNLLFVVSFFLLLRRHLSVAANRHRAGTRWYRSFGSNTRPVNRLPNKHPLHRDISCRYLLQYANHLSNHNTLNTPDQHLPTPHTTHLQTWALSTFLVTAPAAAAWWAR